MGYYNMPLNEHPLKEQVRAKANHYVTGCEGGGDIDVRKFAFEGMKLYGRLQDVRGNVLRFANDLKQNLDQSDSVAENIKTTSDKYIEANQRVAPLEPRSQPLWEPTNPSLELDFVEAKIS